MLVTARLNNPESGVDLLVNVAIDTGSDTTLMTDHAADALGLIGEEKPFKLSGVADVESSIKSRHVEATITSLDGTYSKELKGIQVIPTITNDVKACDWRHVLSKYDLEGYPPAREGEIDLLIGWNNSGLLLQEKNIKISSEFCLVKSPLGWSGCGTVNRKEILEGNSYHVGYLDQRDPLRHSISTDEYQTDNVDLESSDLDVMVERLSFVATSRKESSAETKMLKELIERIQNSTLYDNFPETGSTVEEEHCMKILRESYRVEDGKAYISPLWRKGQPDGFVNNFAHAHGRFWNILKTMSDEDFECIDNIFDSYLNKHKVIEDVTNVIEDPWKEHAIWWAHFPVMNPNSETTPVRPVMDGKAPCINGKSINDHCFHCGPCMINDLVKVLLRYRKYNEAFTGDIPKMFLKVNVPAECKKYNRFIWVQKDRKTLRYLQFKGHVFGNVCSPTCAIYVTQRNASDHQKDMPRAAESVLKSTLMDDTLDSVPTKKEAVRVIKDLVTMYKKIDLNMTKVSTTSTEVSQQLPEDITKSEKMIQFEKFDRKQIEYGGREYSPGSTPKLPTMRALGLYHNMIRDTLGYISYAPDKNMVWTKTKCLSQAMKVFDPLGFAIPVLLETKLFMQDLWRRGTEWTDVLTTEELSRWNIWLNNLPLMEKLSFNRVIMPGTPAEFSSVQLHVFADASELAFASSAYIRITYKDNRPIYTNFIQAKNNIAPMKVKRTIPKLELMAIHQAARLAEHIRETLDINKEDVTIWSDSKTALQWLRMESATLLLLVHNYCEKTKAFFPVSQIRWVPGQENVADIATRPKSVDDLLNSSNWSRWTKGPEFLMESSSAWPTLAALEKTSDVMEGVKKDFKMFSACLIGLSSQSDSNQEVDDKFLIDSSRFRTYGKMLRVFSYVIRFLRKIKTRLQESKNGKIPKRLIKVEPGYKKVPRYVSDKKGNLEVVRERLLTYLPDLRVHPKQDELDEAELRLVHHHQLKYFSSEIRDIKRGKDLLVASKLCRLGAMIVSHKSCFGGNFEILHLGGRLALAPHLSEKARRPFVLHPNDEMVKKMVQYYHTDVLKHMGGVKCLMCELNRSRWIMGSIAHIKRILSECYRCRKLRPKPTIQQMAPLPPSRIPAEGERRLAAFTVTSLDAAGPWTTSQGRGKSLTKRWLLIFRCAKYGAVHLEMLYYMDTASFLLALTRFVSHVSRPKRIYCDNGTNFVRGEKEINLSWDMINKEEVENHERNIEFVWSPAEAPHFNGLVERMIAEAKKNLSAVLPQEKLTDDVLNTGFKEVQRLLNNRPLEPLNPVDPLDLETLTPAHFLANGNIHEDLVPPEIVLEGSDTLAERYWAQKSMMDDFWVRFCRSIGPKLRVYNRWVTQRREVSKGDIVCILEENPEPNSHYRVGQIESVSVGQDKLARRVAIRVKGGKILERGLNRIYVLVPSEKLQPKNKVINPSRRSKRLEARKKRVKNTALMLFTPKYADS